MLPERQSRLESQLFCDMSKIGEPVALGGDERPVWKVGERVALPQVERALDQPRRAAIVAGRECGASLRDFAFEQGPIDLIRIGAEQIAGSVSDDPIAPDDTAEVMNVHLQGGLRAPGRVVLPETVDRLLTRDDLVRVQQQQRQQEPLLRTAKPGSPSLEPHLETSEQAENDRHGSPSLHRRGRDRLCARCAVSGGGW